eukprot:UN08387
MKMLMGSIGDQHLYYLGKTVNKTLKDIQKEQAIREKNYDQSVRAPKPAKNTESKSIFEPHPTDEK